MEDHILGINALDVAFLIYHQYFAIVSTYMQPLTAPILQRQHIAG